jgi:hypothetical protein
VHVAIPLNIHAMNLKNSGRQVEKLCREITTLTCRDRHRLTLALLHSFTEYSSHKIEKFLKKFLKSLMNFMGKVRSCNANSSIDTSRLFHNSTLLSAFTTIGHIITHKNNLGATYVLNKGSEPELKTLPLFSLSGGENQENIIMVGDKVEIRNRHLK